MRNLFSLAVLVIAVGASLATSTAEPEGPAPTTGPWQASASDGGSFTVGPNETVALTLVIAIDDDSTSSLTDSNLEIYLSPSNQQAGAAVHAVLFGGGANTSIGVSFDQESLFLGDIADSCVDRGAYCEATYELEIEHVHGGRLDVAWFAESAVYGDGGIEAPIQLIVTTD